MHVNQVLVLLASYWGGLLKKLLPNVVGISGIWAEDVVEESDINLSSFGSKTPSWDLTLDRNIVLNCGSNSYNSGSNFEIHFYFYTN